MTDAYLDKRKKKATAMNRKIFFFYLSPIHGEKNLLKIITISIQADQDISSEK